MSGSDQHSSEEGLQLTPRQEELLLVFVENPGISVSQLEDLTERGRGARSSTYEILNSLIASQLIINLPDQQAIPPKHRPAGRYVFNPAKSGEMIDYLTPRANRLQKLLSNLHDLHSEYEPPQTDTLVFVL